MRSRHPLQIGECQDCVLVLQTEGVELVFVPQMHFEVADSSSIRGGGRRARPRALMWLGIRPWREGERQWREEESPWRESRESECSVPSIPLGRSGFSRSLRFVCKQFPFLWNGREASFVPNDISRFLSSGIASSKIPVTFLQSKRPPRNYLGLFGLCYGQVHCPPRHSKTWLQVALVTKFAIYCPNISPATLLHEADMSVYKLGMRHVRFDLINHLWCFEINFLAMILGAV